MLRGVVGFAVIVACFGMSSCGDASDSASGAIVLTARRVEAPPFKAGLAGAWASAPAVEVATHHSGEEAGPDVELRALHDGEFVYLMARWADDTRSTTKKAWLFQGGEWTKAEGDEDRLGVAIDGGVPGFPAQGCAVLCHDGGMGAGDAGGVADLWHWKSARGGLAGVADDQHFAVDRSDDAGESAYTVNADDSLAAPARVFAEGADPDGPLTAESSVERDGTFEPSDGYRVPSVLLRTPSGSRGDVEAAADWSDGRWTVVLRRRLDTGEPDDVALAAGETVHVAIAVFDDTGAHEGHEHAKSGPIRLVLE